MTPLILFRWANLLLAFVLELGALGALSYTGAQLSDGRVGATAMAIGLPLVAAVLWGLFAAPRSVKDVPAAKVVVKAAVFGLATIGLLANGHTGLALTFAACIVLNTLALQRTRSWIPGSSGPTRSRSACSTNPAW